MDETDCLEHFYPLHERPTFGRSKKVGAWRFALPTPGFWTFPSWQCGPGAPVWALGPSVGPEP